MKRVALFLVITAVEVHAQGVGADSLRLRSNAGGQAWLLLPQTTTAQYRLLLPSTLGTANHQLMWINGGTGQISLLPPGLDGQVLQYGAGGLSWVSVPTLISGTAWLLTGNSGTNPTTNFLGTTDSQPLVIRTNNTERLRITTDGRVGIGTTTPTQTLHLLAPSGSTTTIALQSVGGGTQAHIWTTSGLGAGGDLVLGANERPDGTQSNSGAPGWLFGFGPQYGDALRIHRRPVGGSLTELFRISAEGYVRIGAGNPTAPLDIQNFGTAALFSLGG
ncbi:MAG: hypothetical protein RML15_09215, partial [Bacteroidota bacterium]|nr:hypothetical protein [Bacteroidota bacterium]